MGKMEQQKHMAEEGSHEKLKEGWVETLWPAWLQRPEGLGELCREDKGNLKLTQRMWGMGKGVTWCRRLVRKSIP